MIGLLVRFPLFYLLWSAYVGMPAGLVDDLVVAVVYVLTDIIWAVWLEFALER